MCCYKYLQICLEGVSIEPADTHVVCEDIHSSEPRSRPRKLKFLLVSIRLMLFMGFAVSTQAQTAAQVVLGMAAREVQARNQDTHYSYLAEEVSQRTGDHRWMEKVIETSDGALHRLLSIDGRALDAQQARAETERIYGILRDPADFRRDGQAHRNDEAHAEKLLELLPKAFLITADGEAGGCQRFVFHPDPHFTPSSYEERVASAMVGTVSVKRSVNRLCRLNATISRPVDFGFGLLGRIEQGGQFTLERVPVEAEHWKSDHIVVHVRGHVLLLKSLAREQNVTRTDLHVVPVTLSVQDAVHQILR